MPQEWEQRPAGEGLFISRGVRDADDQAGHIVHGVQRLIGGKDLTECQHVVVQNADIGLVQDHLCNGGASLTGQLLSAVVVAAVYEGQAQAAGLVHVVCIELGSDHGQIQSAVSQGLQVLGLGAQSCSGVTSTFILPSDFSATRRANSSAVLLMEWLAAI